MGRALSNQTKHRVGILLSFCCGMLLLPVLLFWGVALIWSCAVGIGAAMTLATLRHWRPHLFDVEMGNPDPDVVAGQEFMRASQSAPVDGS